MYNWEKMSIMWLMKNKQSKQIKKMNCYLELVVQVALECARTGPSAGNALLCARMWLPSSWAGWGPPWLWGPRLTSSCRWAGVSWGAGCVLFGAGWLRPGWKKGVSLLIQRAMHLPAPGFIVPGLSPPEQQPGHPLMSPCCPPWSLWGVVLCPWSPVSALARGLSLACPRGICSWRLEIIGSNLFLHLLSLVRPLAHSLGVQLLEGITHAKILEKGNPRFSFCLGKVLKEKPPSIVLQSMGSKKYTTEQLNWTEFTS